jgi:hypothetical protein
MSDMESGFNLHTGNIFAGNVVYDGTILTLTMKDTVTNAQFRMRWPIDIPACMPGNLAYVGFTGGTVLTAQENLLTWDFSTGYNTRLAEPTFSVTPGRYASTQSVALSGPSGAAIHYTLDGQEPTPASPLYASALSVSSNTIVKAISSQSGFTDSYTAVGNYQIQTSGLPLINLPSGFAGAGDLVMVNGSAIISGSNLQLTDTAHADQAGAAWYADRVGCAAFTSTFTLDLSGSGRGMTFCLQNQNPTPAYSLALSYISGGPHAVGNRDNGMGYSGTSNVTLGQISGLKTSVCVKFDLTNNTIGMYADGVDIGSGGAAPTGITLNSGHPLDVVLGYSGTTLSLSITDTVTSVNYTTSWTIDIAATVGDSVSFVGFTGGTGGSTALQKVTKWTYAT